jgi:type VI secretion system FHA domain protein
VPADIFRHGEAMALRLRIVSDHRRQLGDRSSVVFSATGGTIGRSADNDWVLPDPQRYISAHHARVQCRQEGYFLEDLSTNGIFVNDGDRPISKQGLYRLQNGDLLRLGDYQVVVAIEAPGAGPIQPVADAVPTSIEALGAIGRAAQTDIGASLNLDELLNGREPAAPSDSFRLVNAFGQAVAKPAPRPNEEPDDDVIARRIARLAKAASRSNGPVREVARFGAASSPAVYDVQSGLHAFCRGAGIDAERLPADAQTRLLHLAGQLFREALVGLKDLERSQQEARNRMRIDLPVKEDSSPSLARSTIEDVFVDLFSQHESRRLDAVQWLREAIEANKRHGTATAQAMRAAFVDFIGRLDPTELETRFQRTARRNLMPGAAQARYWELFSEFYRNLCEMPQDNLPHTFVEAFANAYKQTLDEPQQ